MYSSDTIYISAFNENTTEMYLIDLEKDKSQKVLDTFNSDYNLICKNLDVQKRRLVLLNPKRKKIAKESPEKKDMNQMPTNEIDQNEMNTQEIPLSLKQEDASNTNLENKGHLRDHSP